MTSSPPRGAFLVNTIKTAIALFITLYIASQVTHHLMQSQPQPIGRARPKYPSGVPRKFDPDGNVQPFPGNTIIAHLSPSSPLYASMLILYAKLEAGPLAHLYALLPPSSWHMTIFEGVCDQVRKPGYWPSNLALDAPLAECNEVFARNLSAFNLQCDPPYKMSIVGFTATGLGLHVEPRTAAENTRLRGLRDRLADELQIRFRGHDTYGLHLSMAYLLRFLTQEQKDQLTKMMMEHFADMPKEFELGAPEFCTFEDMFAFERQFYLKDNEQ